MMKSIFLSQNPQTVKERKDRICYRPKIRNLLSQNQDPKTTRTMIKKVTVRSLMSLPKGNGIKEFP